MATMTDTAIRVVCLDLGGVVVRICRTWQEACARAGVPVRDPARFEAEPLRAKRHAITDAYMAGQMTCAEYWDRIAAHTDTLYTPDEIRAVHLAWTIDDYHGIADLIDRVNATPGLTSACLSNTNHAHWELLTIHKPSPAIARLRRRLVSHHMGLVKPDLAIYRAAERELDARPHEIAFFDDLPENIAAAHNAGWHAFRIDHAGDSAAQITGHLRELGVGVAV
jgi:FMN phosphatase YigB (HAD superfamily)